MGGPEHRNTAKNINEHRITARKVDKTLSTSHTLTFEIKLTTTVIRKYNNVYLSRKKSALCTVIITM